jgi:hypothetical protein
VAGTNETRRATARLDGDEPVTVIATCPTGNNASDTRYNTICKLDTIPSMQVGGVRVLACLQRCCMLSCMLHKRVSAHLQIWGCVTHWRS